MTLLPLALPLLPAVAPAQDNSMPVPFDSAAGWHMECKEERSTDQFATLGSFSLDWDRRTRTVRWESAEGFYRYGTQLQRDDDWTVTFVTSPESPVVQTTDKPVINCCFADMFSVRAQGEFAATDHTIIYGGYKAISREGRCTFTPVDPASIPFANGAANE
ncbi:hypothetical protein FNJ84_09090 [Paracoccus sp. M683]|uniref:hypothetical protein n=1 Tax=Paracoccus sp. M683 TaxID=2594268 RepID=UPI00117E30B0|nr:hypothetical protein [Paracoccus sp. M683]TRW97641.1 hypothetical protein FNJ84_09090 [Paracoccus sp. M683]